MVGLSNSADMDVMTIPDYAAQMESFQRSDEARQKLLADVLQRYAMLMQEHTNLKNDYASERDIRRNYQNEVIRTQRQLAEIQRDLDANSFVLALIDGDGVIFQHQYLLAGANGGSEAASRLQLAIREHINQFYSNSGTWPIMCHIYLSLDKLAHKLAQVGFLRHPQEMRAFAQSFSVNQPLFSIIDVGHGKERADYRIKEMLRTFSDNPTCKHIVFGGCHDAGYLLNLDQYKHNEAKASRITLLETTPAQQGFAKLPNFKKTQFDTVFRWEPLPDISYASTQAPSYAPVQDPAPIQASNPVQALARMKTPISVQAAAPAPAPMPTSVRALSKTSPASTPAPAITSPPPTASPSTTTSSIAERYNDASSGSGESGGSWATVGKNGANNEIISIASLKNNSKKRYAYYNKEGQRLDEPLPPRDRNATESIERRMEKAGRNLCNNWHLHKAQCPNGNFCRFQHEPKLTPAELTALRYKTRSLACKHRNCEDFDCYLGHQCSFERDAGRCPYPDSCNLKSTHGMDKTKYVRYDEEGYEEFSK
ncbi:hypothetical protein CC78DRAFT_615404 [Lojkania enalia]|uniref:C3H1-type domain-containing protein n=1 Tax=Lojkania enalia TaxID=147567 RepID=A0A9P4N7B6_9PLEO|nr:hypothetical protein CC78DRAFT_615404 [Didymosphaeria enalia]